MAVGHVREKLRQHDHDRERQRPPDDRATQVGAAVWKWLACGNDGSAAARDRDDKLPQGQREWCLELPDMWIRMRHVVPYGEGRHAVHPVCM